MVYSRCDLDSACSVQGVESVAESLPETTQSNSDAMVAVYLEVVAETKDEGLRYLL